MLWDFKVHKDFRFIILTTSNHFCNSQYSKVTWFDRIIYFLAVQMQDMKHNDMTWGKMYLPVFLVFLI